MSSYQEKVKLVYGFFKKLTYSNSNGTSAHMYSNTNSFGPKGSSNTTSSITTLHLDSSSSNTGSSSANPASSSSNTGSSSANTGSVEGGAFNLTANSKFDEIPLEIPPTQEKMVSSKSSLWKDLKAKHPHDDEYEQGYFIEERPIKYQG